MRWARVFAIAAVSGGCSGLGSVPPAERDAAVEPDAPAPAQVVAMPQSVDFGSISGGSRSAAITIRIVNIGGETAPAAHAVLTATSPGTFEVTSNTCDNAVLPPESECSVDVVAVGISTGTKTGQLTVGPAIAQLMQVTLGGSELLAVSPTGTLSFGLVQIGSASAARQWTFTNVSGISTGPISVTPSGDTGDFAVVDDTCSGVSLAPGHTCHLDATFTPTMDHLRAQAITLQANPGGNAVASMAGVGAVPLIATPSVLPLGTVFVGYLSAAQSITVTNAGTGTTTALQPTASDGTFVLSGTCTGATLAPGASCTVDVAAHANTAGHYTATVSVEAISMAVSADAVTPAPAIATPTSILFDDAYVTGSAPVQTVTITNPGPFATGAATITRSGTNAGDFTVSADTCTGNSLATGQACSFAVAFSPGSNGSRQGSVTFTANPGGGAMVALSGMGLLPPQIVITPGPVAFGGAGIGMTGMTRTLSVVNNGSVTTGALAISKAGANPGDFVIGTDTCTGAMLPSGGACHVDLTFMPVAPPAGARSASITASTTPGGMMTTQLTGDVITDASGFLVVNPSALAFDRVGVGATATQTFTVSNPGASTTGMVTVTRTGGAAFAATSHCTTLAVGDSCTVDVTFAPTIAGAQQATFTLSPTSGGGAQVVAAGTGVSAAASPASRAASWARAPASARSR